MQREKFYNLQSKAYFNYVGFVFKKSKILCLQFSYLCKHQFFSTQMRSSFSPIFSFWHLTNSLLKKQIIPKDAARKLYNLQSKAYFNCALFVFKTMYTETSLM